MATKATAASTAVAAGVKTPGSGAFSDPATVGAMIQKMYPQYANFDPTTLGQRWIDVHTAAAGSGTGTGTDTGLAGPTGTTPVTSTDPSQQAPDLSGLSQFQSPVKPTPPVAPKIIITGLSGNNPNGTLGTPMSQPTLTPPPKQPKNPQKLSTFDINKVNFGG